MYPMPYPLSMGAAGLPRLSLGGVSDCRTTALLNNLGIIARFRANYDEAQTLMQQSLSQRRGVGDRWAVANSLNNIGVLYRDMGHPRWPSPSWRKACF